MTAAEAETLRAFVALDLDATGLRRVTRLSDRLRKSSGAPSAVWVPTSKMHVTLKFAAKLPRAAVGPLGEALAKIASAAPAPPACALVLGAFPSSKKASVVVAELVDAAGALAKLAARVEKLVLRHGVPAEKRTYRPHVTLARLKIEYDARRWLRPDLATSVGEVRPGAVTLYESRLGADGATYVPLARAAFATSNADDGA